MKHRVRPIILVVALAAFVRPATVSAQHTTTTFNVAGGLSSATSDFGARNESGYSLIVGLGTTQRGSPLSLRAEAMYNEFNRKFGGGKSVASGITGNAVYPLAGVGSSAFTLYGIGGIGLYNTREPNRFIDNENRTNVGWNLGGGVNFPLTGFSAYVEARYHSISNAGVSFAPIVFGLRF